MLTFLAIVLPIITGLLMLKLNLKNKEKYVIICTVITSLLVLIVNIFFSSSKYTVMKFSQGLELSLKVDGLSILFTSIFAIVWILITLYAFEYMSHGKEQNRFFAFFLATFGGLLGVSYASNLFTMYMFFEITSVICYILVIHDRTKKSIQAGRKFIYYSLAGAGLGLISIFYIYYVAGNGDFVSGGISGVPNDNVTLFYLLLAIIGFGCKAGMFPLHGWLSSAHPVAPAPASSILSGLVTKAGIIAIIRMTFYVVGIEIIKGTWLQYTIISLALLTIFMGSMLAYLEKNFKKRLAYSTVSQVSYVILSLYLLSEIGFIGAVLQIVFHVLAKNLLFLVAGVVIYKTGNHNCDELEGLGSQFKTTFIMFTIASLSLVGVPFTGGFVSKWYIANGALIYGNLGLISISVVMISAVLTAGYLFTIVAKTLFCKRASMIEEPVKISWKMTYPMCILSTLIIFFGVYPEPIIKFATNLANALI